jgi:NAD-dependent deacetylase
MPDIDKQIEELKELVATAKRPVAITGAGVSAESGVATFRGDGGLWRDHRPEELATPEAFARDSGLVWRFYEWRREMIRPARPNPAHRWLAEYEREKDEFLLVTQNVDGLHHLAGSEKMVEIHGNLWTSRCTVCGFTHDDREPLEIEVKGLPRCPECAALTRPGVVWFGEALDEGELERSIQAVVQSDLVLVLGTSAVVYPVAGLPRLAKNATIVEINPEATPITASADLSIRAPAGEILSTLSG